MRNENIKYYVNEDKRTVTAVIDHCKGDLGDEVCLITSSYNVEIWHSSHSVRFPNRFVAVAKCHPEDHWDEDIGKKVARRKLFIKYNEAKDRVARAYINKVKSALTALCKKYSINLD